MKTNGKNFLCFSCHSSPWNLRKLDHTIQSSKCVFFVESYRRPCVSCSLGRTHIPTALLLVSRCVSKCARIGGFTAVNWSFYDPLLSKLGLFSSRLEIIYGFYREKMLIFPFTEGLKNFLYFPVNIFLLKKYRKLSSENVTTAFT